MIDSYRPSYIRFSIFLLCQVYLIPMEFMEMAGMLFYVKVFRYYCQIPLVDSVLDNVQDYILITNLMHKLLSIHIILRSSTRYRLSSHSICIPTGHHDRSLRVTVPYATCIQCDLLKMSIYGSKHVEECNIT